MAALAGAATDGCGGDSPSKGSATSTASPPEHGAQRTFDSEVLPYRLTLPSGWAVDPPSQGPGSDADEFVSADGSERLVVGHGYPKPGETTLDRVTANRTDETATGCISDPEQDQPIAVNGEHGILWSYTCAPDNAHVLLARDAYYLSAQAIHRRAGHRRVGYRFTVVVPLAEKSQAKPLVDRFLSGLTFLKVSPATGDA